MTTIILVYMIYYYIYIKIIVYYIFNFIYLIGNKNVSIIIYYKILKLIIFTHNQIS